MDCLNGMKLINDESIDMILCDLPYGVTARNKWDTIIPFAPLWIQYERIIKPNGAIVLFGQGMFTARLMISNEKLWRYNLIWGKTQPTGFLNANKMPLRNHEDICIFNTDNIPTGSHEDICVFYKKLPMYHPQKTSGHHRKVSKAEHKLNCKTSTNYENYRFSGYDSTERYPVSILVFAKDTQKSKLHPTQKPLALCEYLIRTYTNKNDIVLDNCMGSGTTAIACIKSGRSFIGFETESEFVEVAGQRIKEHVYTME